MNGSYVLEQLHRFLSDTDVLTLTTIVAFLLTEFLLLVIATFLTVKALLLRRRSELGRKLAANNVAMAAAFYTAFFGLWFPILKHPALGLAVRVSILFTALSAIHAFVKFYGGWRATASEVGDSLREMRAEIADEVSGRAHRRRAIEKARRLYLPTR